MTGALWWGIACMIAGSVIIVLLFAWMALYALAGP